MKVHGWAVVIRSKNVAPFFSHGANFFRSRKDAMVLCRQCREHNLKEITVRVRMETI